MPRAVPRAVPMSATFWRNTESYGGLWPEAVLATVPVGGDYLCGVQVSFPDAGPPHARLLRRTTADDLARMGFVRTTPEAASTLCDALTSFVAGCAAWQEGDTS